MCFCYFPHYHIHLLIVLFLPSLFPICFSVPSPPLAAPFIQLTICTSLSSHFIFICLCIPLTYLWEVAFLYNIREQIKLKPVVQVTGRYTTASGSNIRSSPVQVLIDQLTINNIYIKV